MSTEALLWLAIPATAVLAGVFAWESWRGRPPKGQHRPPRAPRSNQPKGKQ